MVREATMTLSRRSVAVWLGVVLLASSVPACGTSEVHPLVGPLVNWMLLVSKSQNSRERECTVLPDGTVLLVGGGPAGEVAELYQPTTGTFERVGDMTVARPGGHSGTLLHDGTVLVVGGDGAAAGSAELFDPLTGTFSQTPGRLNGEHTGHVAVRLRDDRVLVVCGRDATTAVQTVVEIYDPRDGIFRVVPGMAEARADAFGTLLADGHVLVGGGVNAANDAVSSSELFDPVTDAWIETGALCERRGAPTGVLLHDGRVLLTGGVLPSGRVLVAGGTADGTGDSTTAEVYGTR